MMDRAKTLLLAGICVFSGILHGATYYVALTGSNWNSGTISSPWQTISYGVGRLIDGDTLLIRGGEYYLTDMISPPTNTSGNWITIKGYPGEKVVLNVLHGTQPGDWSLVDAVKDVWELNNFDLVANGGYYDSAHKTDYTFVKWLNTKPGTADTLSMFSQMPADGNGYIAQDYNNRKLWVHAPGGGNPGSQGIMIGRVGTVFLLMDNRNNYRFENLTFTGADQCITTESYNVDNVYIKNCTFIAPGLYPIKIGSPQDSIVFPWHHDNITVDNCDIYYYGAWAVDFHRTMNGLIKNTSIHHSIPNYGFLSSQPFQGDAVLAKNGCDGIVIEKNRIWGIKCYSIACLGGDGWNHGDYRGKNETFKNNIISDLNCADLLQLGSAFNTKVYNNSFYNIDIDSATMFEKAMITLNQTYHSALGGGFGLPSKDNYVYNNLFYNIQHDKMIFNNRHPYTLLNNTDGFMMNNNLYQDQKISRWDDSINQTYSYLLTTEGLNTATINDAPTFVDASKELYRLDTTSVGASGGFPYLVSNDYNGSARKGLPAIGALEVATPYAELVKFDGTNTSCVSLTPSGTVTSVFDSILNSNVIRVYCSTSGSVYFKQNPSDWAYWEESDKPFLRFKMKCAQSGFQTMAYVTLKGSSTIYYLKYSPSYAQTDFSDPYVKKFPLPNYSTTAWNNLEFNLQADWALTGSNNVIDKVQRLYFGFSGELLVDDVTISNKPSTKKAMVAEYTMNEATGEYVEDSSGYDRHGQIKNMTTGKVNENPLESCWIIGKDTKAVDIQADGDYLELPSLGSVDWTGGLTFSCWYNPRNITTSYREIASRLTGYGSYYPRVYQMNNCLAVQLFNNVTSTYEHITFSSSLLTEKTWQHIAVSVDIVNRICNVYVNGVKESKSFNTTAILTGSGSAMLGGNVLLPTHSVQAAIDNVKIYNRILTDSEISALSLNAEN